jgi:Tfp pilus assembly protein PilX
MAVTRTRAEEYRRRAQECLDLARKISLERERAIILDMAQSWLRLAEQQEAQEENPSPPAVEQQPQAAAQQQQQVQPKDEDKKE